MTSSFTPAKKYRSRLRLGLSGPSGSGKTFSALAIASGMGEKIAVIDTEHGSAAMYADRFQFDVLELDSFDPRKYVESIQAAEQAGYDVLVIDSLSHAWSGKDGALEQVDRAAARSRAQNTFAAWREVTPLQNRLVDAITGARLHVICTLRAKTEYVLENQNGKQVPRKVGMAPVQRDLIEYEFSVYGEIDAGHNLLITKSRIESLQDAFVEKPDQRLGAQLISWLAGEEPPERASPQNGHAAGAPPALADDIAALLRAWHAKEPQAASAYVGVLLASYPYARGENGRFSPARLIEADAGQVLALLKESLASKSRTESLREQMPFEPDAEEVDEPEHAQA
ncbi:MAG: ATP-binding protein [Solirubrobacteraceae bacterium]